MTFNDFVKEYNFKLYWAHWGSLFKKDFSNPHGVLFQQMVQVTVINDNDKILSFTIKEPDVPITLEFIFSKLQQEALWVANKDYKSFCKANNSPTQSLLSHRAFEIMCAMNDNIMNFFGPDTYQKFLDIKGDHLCSSSNH